MESIRYFNHALRQVTGNFPVALRMSALLFIAMVIATLSPTILGYDLREIAEQVTNRPPGVPVEGEFQLLVFGLAISLFNLWVWSLLAVVWHRFVLLEEPPAGWLPLRPGFRIWGYVWQAIKVVLIVFLPLLVAMVMGSAFLMATGEDSILYQVLIMIVGTFAMTGILRLGITLPEIALFKGKTMTLTQAWDKTQPYNSVILGVALISVVLNMFVTFGFSLLADFAGLSITLSVMLKLAIEWLFLLVNVSLITTLYGRIVQDRQIF